MLRIFVSSTVEDFGPVREELKARLEQRSHGAIQVTLSESIDFPVEPGVTSHEACLRAIEGIDVFVLLIGHRFGGHYPDSDKSITWMEWEAALEAAAERGVIVVPLILRAMNDKAREVFKRRSEWKKTTNDDDEIDRQLRKEFPDSKPFVDDLPSVQRFIDAVRKGHEDNWVHTWSGTVDHALAILESRLVAALSAYRARSAGARHVEIGALNTTRALAKVADQAAALAGELKQQKLDRDRAAEQLLAHVEDRRADLFGFTDDDIYNFMLYRRDGDLLRAGPRACDPAMKRRDRSWKVGQGHVGLAAQNNVIMVTGDLRGTDGWKPTRDSERSDARVYVSAIGVPLYLGGDTHRVDGVFIVTSSRLGHFQDKNQRETLTAVALGRILTMLWM